MDFVLFIKGCTRGGGGPADIYHSLEEQKSPNGERGDTIKGEKTRRKPKTPQRPKSLARSLVGKIATSCKGWDHMVENQSGDLWAQTKAKEKCGPIKPGD